MEEDKVKVVVRVRPEIAVEFSCDATCMRKDGDVLLVEQGPGQVKEYSFDEVFGSESTQEEVYKRSCLDIVSDLLQHGNDGCILCYGQSGSGKTFTMLGPDIYTVDDISFGLVQRSLYDILTFIEKSDDEELSTSKVYLSAFDIMSDEIYDVLAPDNHVPFQPNLDDANFCFLQEVRSNEYHVEGLSHHFVSDFDSGLQLLDEVIQCQIPNVNHRFRKNRVIQITVERPVKTGKTDSAISCYIASLIFVTPGGSRCCRSVLAFFDLSSSDVLESEEAGTVALKEGGFMDQSILSLGNLIKCFSRTNRSSRRYFALFRRFFLLT